MQLTVESVTKSKSGKALRVKAGDIWYGARLNSGLDAAVGKTVEAEVHNDEKFGWQIDAYKVTGSAAPSTPQATPKQAEAPSYTPVWGNFVSNQVAHAISAGLITEPAHIKLWAAAAKQAYTEIA